MSRPRTRRPSLPVLAGSALACALAGPLHAQSAPPTVEELARRLQAIEQRLGTAETAGTATADASGLADLDQRLRVIERRLELQEEEAQAKAAWLPAKPGA